MKAVVIREHGGIDKLVYGEIDTPAPGPGEILVKIEASGINHLDHDVREGASGMAVTLPHVPGSEGAGKVAALGPGVTRPTIGDRVAIHMAQGDPTGEMWLSGLDGVDVTFGRLGVSRWGTHAQYVVCQATSAIPLPDRLSYRDAAASVVGLGTAWHMAVTLGRVRADHTVLINAVGGVVGSAALQIVKLHGARVIASASSYAKLDKAKALGADAVVNYSSRNLRGEVLDLTRGRGVDLVIESVGGDVLVHSIAALCDNGRLVTCGAHAGETVPIDIVELFRKHLTIHGAHLAGRREIARVLALVADGKLRPVIDSVHPLKDIRVAAAKTANREAFGKMVLEP